VSHKIILNRTASPTTLGSTENPGASYTFEYAPPHDQSAEQAAHQFAKIQKHLEKAAAIAAGEPVE
jgi:hypothetical protein